jgi:hypothetical protein
MKTIGVLGGMGPQPGDAAGAPDLLNPAQLLAEVAVAKAIE